MYDFYDTLIIIMLKTTPLGTLSSGQALAVTPKDRIGNLYMLGRAGTGKSVVLESIVYSDIMQAKGGMLLDPYGDLIQEVLPHVPKQLKANIIHFKVVKGSAEYNIKRFNQQVDWSVVQNNPQIFLFCNLSYFTIGSHTARTIGRHILKTFYRQLGKVRCLANRSLFVDEAHNFIDEAVLKQLAKSKSYKLRTILLDQSLNEYANDTITKLLSSVDKVLCFSVNTRTATLVANKFKLSLSPETLVNTERYHFYAKLGKTKTTVKVKGVLPLSCPKA